MGAIGAAYATYEEYAEAISKPSNKSRAAINVDLNSVSRFVERKLGVQQVGFNKDAIATTRHQRVLPLTRDAILWLDIPLAEAPTSVIIDTTNDGDFTDETALTLTEFTGDVIYHPLGGLLGITEPITGIELTQNATQNAAQWPEKRLVQIIGKHGWPDVPEPIKSGVIQLTAILRLDTPRATGQIVNVDTVLNISPPAMRIVNDLLSAYTNVGSLI